MGPTDPLLTQSNSEKGLVVRNIKGFLFFLYEEHETHQSLSECEDYTFTKDYARKQPCRELPNFLVFSSYCQYLVRRFTFLLPVLCHSSNLKDAFCTLCPNTRLAQAGFRGYLCSPLARHGELLSAALFAV